MSKRQKRVEAMKNNPAAVRFETLAAAMGAAGFTSRQRGTSHVVYTSADGGTHVTVTKPHGGQSHVDPAYVRNCLAALGV